MVGGSCGAYRYTRRKNSSPCGAPLMPQRTHAAPALVGDTCPAARGEEKRRRLERGHLLPHFALAADARYAFFGADFDESVDTVRQSGGVHRGLTSEAARFINKRTRCCTKARREGGSAREGAPSSHKCNSTRFLPKIAACSRALHPRSTTRSTSLRHRDIRSALPGSLQTRSALGRLEQGNRCYNIVIVIYT